MNTFSQGDTRNLALAEAGDTSAPPHTETQGLLNLSRQNVGCAEVIQNLVFFLFLAGSALMSSLNDLHPADVVCVITKSCLSYFKQ